MYIDVYRVYHMKNITDLSDKHGELKLPTPTYRYQTWQWKVPG